MCLALMALTACASVESTPTPDAVGTLVPQRHPEAVQTLALAPKPVNTTQTAIMVDREATRAALEITLTAMPTPTPSPTFPFQAPMCQPSDLSASVNPGAAEGAAMLTVQIVNSSKSPCFLQGMPNVQVVDGSAYTLSADYYSFCFLACKSDSVVAIPDDDTQKELQNSQAFRHIGLEPGASVHFIVIWQNWCQGPINGGAILQLRLPSLLGTISIPTGVDQGGKCTDSSDHSLVGVSEYGP
jgi:hypothetical protein